MLGMISCKEAARLASETRDHELPFRTRIALRLHLGICRMCKIYNRQITMLGEISRRANTVVMQASLPLALTTDAKERIKQKLSEQK